MPARGARDLSTEQPNRILQRFCRAVIVQNGGNLTDEQLLECFVSRRDEVAFEALVRRHGPMVLGVCRRVLRNLQDAEDAFQATFLVLVRKATSISQRERLGNWLYGVAYRTALAAKAENVRRRVREQLVGTMPERELVEVADICRDLRPLLDRELNCLPDKYRMAIVLCDLEERTRRDVARQLGIPVGTLSGRLTVARAMLARRLACRGLALSVGALIAMLSQNAASACLPSRLVVSTVEAALAAAAKQPTAMVSDLFASPTDGGMKAMSLKTLSIAAAMLLAVGALIGSGMPSPAVASKRADEPKVDGPKHRAVPEMKPRVLNLDSRGRRVVWSPDGKTLAVVTKVETMLTRKGAAIKLWDVEKGQVRDTLVEYPNGGLGFGQVAFSPDGKTIAATVSEEVVLPNARLIHSVVKIWNAKTLDFKQVLGGNESQLHHVVFTSDSKMMAACDPSQMNVTLWNMVTGELIHTLETKRTQPWYAAFSPDNKILVVGGQKGDKSGEVTLWDVKTGKLKLTLEQEKYINAVAFSPDGKIVASSDGGELTQIWNAEKGELLVSLKGSTQGSRALTFLSNKTVAVGGRDGKIRLWDVQTGKLADTLEGHTDEVHSIACSPDGKTLASVSQDETLRLWPIGKWTSETKQRP